MPTVIEQGEELLQRAEELIVQVLGAEPQGLTNAEIGERTGLSVAIARQQGYISWSLLQRMHERGLVRRDGRRYVLTA